MQKWCGLAVVLSGLWLVGLTFYGFWAWDHREQYCQPFFTAEHGWVERPSRDGTDLWPVTRWVLDWPLFVGAFGAGGVVAIWVLVAGVPWAVAGFREGRLGPSAPSRPEGPNPST